MALKPPRPLGRNPSAKTKLVLGMAKSPSGQSILVGVGDQEVQGQAGGLGRWYL